MRKHSSFIVYNITIFDLIKMLCTYSRMKCTYLNINNSIINTRIKTLLFSKYLVR